ncbi:hypothetical protein GCM10009737_16110 [Nocardioides lentus]|uniref:Restriction endonuclease type IV Mrr domain-containing protein n=1 Tax=Nocardioides lentus TaxID=338077 RepID=A0ABP5ALQ4_9ACTN
MTNDAVVGADPPDRAFGAENRARLLTEYFDAEAAEEVRVDTSWRHVYHLLMWIDRTIGLAHCYESDKCQPGRPWYARSLRFHQWLAEELGTTASDLSPRIDWLFTTAAQDLARSTELRSSALGDRGLQQRAPYEHLGMPLPGEDPELASVISETLDELPHPIPDGLANRLADRILVYLGSENKRKNLVGEGFEDTLASIFRRVDGIADRYDIFLRPALHELPGFNRPRGGDKTKRVDLALVRKSDNWRVLVSCKWSVRSDREEQFGRDFDAYARLESLGKNFGYVMVTNEFDPARLAAACEMRQLNELIFTDVVHVNPEGPRAVYEVGAPRRIGGGIERVIGHMDTGRLSSLESWLRGLQVSS